MKSPIVWVCGQVDEYNDDIWGIVGVFSSEKKAVAACKNENYFVSPYKINSYDDTDEKINKDYIGYYPHEYKE
jgi:hypothetical protein